MNLVNMLKTAVGNKDWALVSKALDVLAGDEEFVVYLLQSNKLIFYLTRLLSEANL